MFFFFYVTVKSSHPPKKKLYSFFSTLLLLLFIIIIIINIFLHLRVLLAARHLDANLRCFPPFAVIRGSRVGEIPLIWQMCRGVVERGPLAVPSRMLKLQFILSTLEPGLKETDEIKEVRFRLFFFPPPPLLTAKKQKNARDHQIWRRGQRRHYEFCFPPDVIHMEPALFILKFTRFVACDLSCALIFSCMHCILFMCQCGCVFASVFTHSYI